MHGLFGSMPGIVVVYAVDVVSSRFGVVNPVLPTPSVDPFGSSDDTDGSSVDTESDTESEEALGDSDDTLDSEVEAGDSEDSDGDEDALGSVVASGNSDDADSDDDALGSVVADGDSEEEPPGEVSEGVEEPEIDSEVVAEASVDVTDSAGDVELSAGVVISEDSEDPDSVVLTAPVEVSLGVVTESSVVETPGDVVVDSMDSVDVLIIGVVVDTAIIVHVLN
ncbi:hypothetical protein GCK72_016536 [Caenorhabditis remanei]|uniref:Uncharacterized protein n=1 Tax=Caenorhabditis remanei TaxID=31234 RepID=A0A6A5G5G8_CAERE|nr:hypothetical protein GCK72_016536 [Caenorhabditis remanei]KAF1749991.1 hypothetical protein GCK72_016536 [Caenorhabditis remanei]